MSRKPLIVRLVTTFILLLSLVSLGLADTLRLKDGSLIKGRIVKFEGGSFTISIGEAARQRNLTFLASEVESIQFTSPADEPSTAGKSSNRDASYTSPQPAPPKSSASVLIPGRPKANSGSGATPIEWRVKVLADSTANGWTNSGWVVKKGQRIRITGDGKVSLGKGNSSTPAGSPSVEDGNKLLKNVATGALVAVIGDDNNDFIYIGSEREFTATRDGALFLGINEGHLEDNSGSFEVKIEILP